MHRNQTAKSRPFFPRKVLWALIAFIWVWAVLPAPPAHAEPETGLGIVGTAVFYTAAVKKILVLFLINAPGNNREGIHYSGLFMLVLILIWMLEGGLSAALPALPPGTGQAFTWTFGLVIASYGYWIAERSLDPDRPLPGWRKILRTLAFLPLALIPLTWFYRTEVLALILNMLLIGMILSHIPAALTWRTFDTNRQPLAFAAAIVAGVIVLALFIPFALGRLGDTDRITGMRLGFSVAVLSTMAAVMAALIDVRRARDAALEAALVAARKDAKTSAALFEMEKNYSRARDIAARRTRQLSSASHDIRQPLASMRAELDVLKDGIADTQAERLDRILNHMDALTADLSRTGHQPADGDTDDTAREKPEKVPAAVLLATLERIFSADAKSKGIKLRVVPSKLEVMAPALVLMRIASNLIANALAHSKAKTVLVGFRRTGEEVRLEIIDNGIGFDTGTAFEAGVKGNASAGSGLGLSIVRELTDRHGLQLATHTASGKGTHFGISLPRA